MLMVQRRMTGSVDTSGEVTATSWVKLLVSMA
jgi:hypothetical protein